jgi:hypothetical protein
MNMQVNEETLYAGELDAEQLDEKNREIRELLYEGVYEVTFTKVNGETRTMPCTLDSTLLPPQPLKEYHETRAYKPETLSVWCLDKMEWRSFRVANVTKIVRTQ